MKKKNLITFLFFLTILFPGCINVNEEFSALKDKVLSSSGNKYQPTAQFSVGAEGITISSWFIDFAQDEEYIADMMREVDNVQVGIYERLKDVNHPGYKTLLEINNDMESAGWKHFFRSVEDDEL